MAETRDIVIATLAAAVIRNKQVESAEEAVKVFNDVKDAYTGELDLQE